MTKRVFWTRLALPLISLFGISIFVHTRWEADAFFLNLGTELVGILITISYVDWILRHHERQRWLPTDTRIADRLMILLNGTVAGVRRGLGFGPDIFDEQITANPDPLRIHSESIRVAEHVLAPSLGQRIRKLDQNGWKSLVRQIQHSHNGVLEFLQTFQNRLQPDQIAHLLDLQECLANSLTFYTTFPELFGVSGHELPETRTPPELLQEYAYETTAKELRNALALVKKLSQSNTNN